MPRLRRVLGFALLLASLLALTRASQAQQPQQYGRILGLVRVLRGDFPPNPVLITLSARGAPIDTIYADGQGRFGFNNLLANQYVVSVDDDAFKAESVTVDVNPATSPTNFVQLTLTPRESSTKDTSSRVSGANPYLIDPAEYNSQFPKKTLKEFDRGVEADHAGKPDEAVEHYQKALSYSPTYYPAHNNLGSIYLARQDFALAQSEFEAAKKANQNDPQACFNLANVLLLTGHYPEADREIEQGFQRRPDSAFGRFLKGLFYSHTGNAAEAEKSLQDALQLDPKMSQARLQLVNLYLQQKRNADAIGQLETYLKDSPDSPYAPKVRETLKRLQSAARSTPQ